MTDREESSGRAGFVALAGAPNVGKSTLLNRILGRRLSISTPKPQTTRNRVVGIYTCDAAQLVFIDTPGIHETRGLINQRMVKHAKSSIREADVICWIIDAARGMRSADYKEIPHLVGSNTLLLLNKTDLVSPADLLPLIDSLRPLAADSEIIPLSARSGDNLDTVLHALCSRVPQGPRLYGEDELTDRNERFLAAELVREQLFLQLDEELPYRVAVLVEEFKDEGKRIYIAATVYTDSDSSKRMIIGKGGARIKEVGTKARRRIQELLERHVYLDLHVKVKPRWQQDPRFLEELGI